MDWATIMKMFGGQGDPLGGPAPQGLNTAGLEGPGQFHYPTPGYSEPGQVQTGPMTNTPDVAPSPVDDVAPIGPRASALSLNAKPEVESGTSASRTSGDPSGGRGTRAQREGDGSVGAAIRGSGGVSSQSRAAGPTSVGGRPLGAQGPVVPGSATRGHQPLYEGFASQEPAAAASMGKPGAIADALKGVKAPAAPDVVKPSTPAAPRPTSQIQGGGLQQLLALMLGGGGGGGQVARRPTTLGGTVGR